MPVKSLRFTETVINTQWRITMGNRNRIGHGLLHDNEPASVFDYIPMVKSVQQLPVFGVRVRGFDLFIFIWKLLQSTPKFLLGLALMDDELFPEAAWRSDRRYCRNAVDCFICLWSEFIAFLVLPLGEIAFFLINKIPLPEIKCGH